MLSETEAKIAEQMGVTHEEFVHAKKRRVREAYIQYGKLFKPDDDDDGYPADAKAKRDNDIQNPRNEAPGDRPFPGKRQTSPFPDNHDQFEPHDAGGDDDSDDGEHSDVGLASDFLNCAMGQDDGPCVHGDVDHVAEAHRLLSREIAKHNTVSAHAHGIRFAK